MSYDKVYNDICIKTGRPDRVQEIKQAIKDALNEYHGLAFFARDIQEGEINFSTRDKGMFDLRKHIPNLRKVMAVFKDDQRLRLIDPIASRNLAGYYIMGNYLRLNPDNLHGNFQLLYAVNPDPHDSWILRDYPDAVVALASARVAGIVGNQRLFQALMVEVGAIHPVRAGYKLKITSENEAYEPDAIG